MTQQPTQSPHNVELQSLRGIAAAVVMVHHALRTLAGTSWALDLSEVPLNAHAAVIIFFVLSGYVLTGSLMRRGISGHGVGVFYVRRLFRVFPALWLGVVLGTAYLLYAARAPAPGLSEWMQIHSLPFRAGVLHVALNLAGLENILLPPAWTITVELCASLLLPAMVLVFLRAPVLVVPIVLLLAVVTAVAGPAARNVPFYLVDFALGAGLACAPWVERVRPGAIGMIAALVVLLFIQILPQVGTLYWFSALAMGLASAVLIRGLVTTPIAWLRHRSLVALGDWSYSLYLLHLPIAFTVARLMARSALIGTDANITVVIIAVITAAITLPVSALVYRFVEQPGIALGNRVIRRLLADERSTSPLPVAADG